MPFRGNVFQGQVSNPGVGSGINAISTSNYALQGLINNEANNRNRLINSALGVGGKVFADTLNNRAQDRRQEDQQTADVDLLKMKLPFENATKQASLLNAAQSAEDNGDPGTAQQLRALASRFGGGIADMFQTPGINSEAGSQFFSQPLGSQTSTNFEPILDAGTDPGIPQGQEFALPKPEPFSGFSGTYSGQENQADVAKKTTDAQTAKINLNNVQGLQQASRLPDGTSLKDSTGTSFINLKMNDKARGLLNEGMNLRANDPKKASDIEIALGDNSGQLTAIVDEIIKIEKGAKLPHSKENLKKAAKGFGNIFMTTPFEGVNKTVAGFQNDNFEEAFNASDRMEGLITGIAKALQGGGVVSDVDVAAASKAVPRFDARTKEEFDGKKQLLATSLLKPSIEKAFEIGSAVRYNEYQKLYKKLTGKFYKIGDDEQTVDETQSTNQAPRPDSNGNQVLRILGED